MNRSNTEQKSASGSVVSNTANTRISGSKLIVARAVWLGLVILSLGFFVISLPVYYTQIQRACVDPVTCNVTFSLTAQGLRALAAIGFSASGYAVFVIIFSTIIVAVWSGIGFLIFWRRSDEWFALLAAFFLITFNPTYPGSPAYALVIVYPILALPAEIVNFLGQASLILFLFLFHDGRLVPRWMGLIVLISLIQITASISPPTSPFNENNWPVWLDTTISLLSYGAVIFSQIYRYRRVSNAAQRKQTKWVVLGLSIVFTGFIAFTLLLLFFQVSSPEFSQPNSIYMLLPDIAFPVLFLFLPISIGIAILRYRLYDIDILINRTLVYGTLTASLALVYVGLVIGLGSLVRLFTGQVSQSPIVIVASTLVGHGSRNVSAGTSPCRVRS